MGYLIDLIRLTHFGHVDSGLPKFNPTEDGNESDGTPDAPPDPTEGADAITNGNQEDGSLCLFYVSCFI